MTLRGETVTLIAQLNASWRVLRIADRPGWGPPSWSIQQQVDGEWCGKAVVRTAHMLREMVKAWCGTIDPDAARKLSWLPERCDRDPSYPSPPREPKKRPRSPAGASKRAALAAQFLTWRDGNAHSRPVVRSQPETAPTPPRAENNSQAARAASARQQAEAAP